MNIGSGKLFVDASEDWCSYFRPWFRASHGTSTDTINCQLDVSYGAGTSNDVPRISLMIGADVVLGEDQN